MRARLEAKGDASCVRGEEEGEDTGRGGRNWGTACEAGVGTREGVARAEEWEFGNWGLGGGGVVVLLAVAFDDETVGDSAGIVWLGPHRSG